MELEETNKANKDYQSGLLEKSKRSLKEVSIKERDHSAIILATNRKKLYEAKGIIKNFRKNLCEFLEDVEQKDTVYALQISFFPLAATKKEDK